MAVGKVFVVLLLCAAAAADRCRMKPGSLYPPPANASIDWVIVNLDDPPEVYNHCTR